VRADRLAFRARRALAGAAFEFGKHRLVGYRCRVDVADVRLLHRDVLRRFRDVRRVSLMPYYRISLKAARRICNTAGAQGDARNARPALVLRLSTAHAAAWRRFRKGYLFTSIEAIHAP
jgi:hypothetical protein